MHRYFIKTPWLVKYLFPGYIWNIPVTGKTVFLTFDDGPHPEITPWILDLLKQYRAFATFFCVGSNVQQHQPVYERILQEGHSVGNHTQNHLNGWKVSDNAYLEDIREATRHIRSNLFRPPYGRIRARQAKKLHLSMGIPDPKIIMWDVLSADFDSNFTPRQCLQFVRDNMRPGSIIVFHDSEKAYASLRAALPELLEWMNKEGWNSEKISSVSFNN